jgi:hypothetical protein
MMEAFLQPYGEEIARHQFPVVQEHMQVKTL